jgi:predicted RNA-binding protein
MICPECRYEYFSKKDVHLFKCPVCKSNFIKSIIDYSNDSNPLNLFRDAIRYMGTELLKDKQTLLKLIPKLYHSDLILSKLLVISVNEAIAAGMYNLIQVEDRDGKLNSLKQKLITEAFLSEDAAHKIIDSWCYVLDFDENENTIKNCSNSIAKSNYLLNSKGEIIYVNKNDNFNIFFSEGLAYTGGNRNGQYYINVKGENVLDLNALISPQVVNLKNEFYEWNYNYGDFQDGLAFLERNIGIKKYGFIDKKAKIIINCIYEEALPFSEQLAAVKLDGLWGFINTKGETVIKHKYDKAFQFHDGIALVEGNGNWTFIDKKGDIKLSLNKYKDVQPFNEGLARVKNDKYGYIDKLGNEIISLKYNDTKSISNDFIPVKIKKWGVINKNDEIIVPFEFDYVKILEIDSIIVGKKVPPYNHEEYIYGLYSKLGDELLKVEYNSIHAVDKDTMFVKKIEIENCIDDDGREFEDENELFGLYIISENKLSKMKNSYENSYNSDSKVNNYKNLIITDYYDGIALACEGYFEKSYLYLDKKGKLLIDRKFKEATDFVNGISKVEIYLPDLNLGIENHPCYKYGFRSFNKYGTGYINKRGKWIYSSRNSVDNNLTTNHFYKYDMVIPNSFGLNSACINGVWCIVDNSGKEIIGLKYHLMYCIDENIIGYRGKINEEFKWGLMDRNEKIIAPCKYNNLPFFEGNLSMVFYENKVGCIDKEGNENLLLEAVDTIVPSEDGIVLENIFCERKTVKARIREMALVEHRIVLEEV